ncbi:plastocyanin/azurin family copper-binding protein [Planococcus alpniumensis]|uniref:plastocyanin/azurin family copper-binding protein n=1 Tax=Planococcus alpniumensis TaxID=2708345 RepID=UPI001B8C2821|nr:plastocyanin/azurin family copper-binding protein [Planococcus sp. MSAK28401]
MANKKFTLLLAAGMLSLAACGQDDAANEEETQAPAQEESTEMEEMPEEEPMEDMEEDPETEEDSTEEEPAEEAAEEEPAEDAESGEQASAPEAMSGEASDLLSNGEMTSFVFNEAGEYAIYCEPHPVMQMTVIVEEGAEAMDKVSVDIADYEFGEDTITVAPGTTIEWTNQDQVQHNVAFE